MKLQLRRAFGVGLHRLREDVVVLVAAKLEPPRLLSSVDQRRKRHRLLAQQTQLFAFHFAAAGIEPDFPPVIARDFNGAFGRHRLLVSIERFDVDRDFVFRAIDVLLRRADRRSNAGA